jgi:hypothetical protein
MSPGSMSASAATIGYTTQQTEEEYIIHINIRFNPKDVRVKIQEIDGKHFLKIIPSKVAAKKSNEFVPPGDTTMGGYVPLPKKASTEGMSWVTQKPLSMPGTNSIKTVTENGLWVHLKKLSPGPEGQLKIDNGVPA